MTKKNDIFDVIRESMDEFIGLLNPGIHDDEHITYKATTGRMFVPVQGTDVDETLTLLWTAYSFYAEISDCGYDVDDIINSLTLAIHLYQIK